ncbi:hypothetical protein [Alcaligenes sp. GCM10023179]|uniref:hypothetical protein n=1 Tax=Alcaligenes sp. GCM10023179 TaxID=3252633 RepID=UPI000E1FDC59
MRKTQTKGRDGKRGVFYLDDMFGQEFAMAAGIAAPGACTRSILFEFLTYPHFVGKALVCACSYLVVLEEAW